MSNTLTSRELADKFYQQQEERKQDPRKWQGLSYNHPLLDKSTGGARRGELIVIAGAQKSGKTSTGLAMCLSWARQLKVAGNNEYVLFISLEMAHSSIASRIMANLSGLPINVFRDYKVTKDQEEIVGEALGTLKEMPGLWNVGATNIDKINQVIDTFEKDRGIKTRIVVVDYFQLMSGTGVDMKRWEQLEQISGALKRMALTREITVVALSQQSREALSSIKKQKNPNTIAGTQALARDADLMLIILPKMENEFEVPHKREIYVALSRNSEMNVSFEAAFSGTHARFGQLFQEDLRWIPKKTIDNTEQED